MQARFLGRRLGRRLRHRSPGGCPAAALCAQRLLCVACLAMPPPPLVSRPAGRRRLAMLREQREAADVTRKTRCLARRWSTWRRDGLASGWRRPSAGLRVISRLGLRALHPPRLVGAGTVAMALLLSGLVHRSSSDGTSRAIACRAIMRAAAQRGGRLHTLHEGVLTTAPPAQVWGRRGGPFLLRGSLDLGVRTACRAASRPLPNVGFWAPLSSPLILRAGRAWPRRGWTWTRS